MSRAGTDAESAARADFANIAGKPRADVEPAGRETGFVDNPIKPLCTCRNFVRHITGAAADDRPEARLYIMRYYIIYNRIVLNIIPRRSCGGQGRARARARENSIVPPRYNGNRVTESSRLLAD